MRRPWIIKKVRSRNWRRDLAVEDYWITKLEDGQPEEKSERKRVNFNPAGFIPRLHSLTLTSAGKIKNAISTGLLRVQGLPARWYEATAEFAPGFVNFPKLGAG